VAVIAPLRGPFATVRVEVVHIAHLDLLDALQFVPVEVKRRVDALSLLVMAPSWRLDCAWDSAGLRESSGVLCTLSPSFCSWRIGRCDRRRTRVATRRHGKMTIAVSRYGCRRTSARCRRLTRNIHHDLACAEDLGERNGLEREVLVGGNILEQCYTFPGLLRLFHICV